MGTDRYLCYQPTDWHQYLWSKFREAEEIGPLLDRGAKKVGEPFPVLPEEMFHRLYSYEERPIPEDDRPLWSGWCAKAHACADELPEFSRLKRRTVGDPAWAGVAAASITEELLKQMPDPPEPAGDMAQLARQLEGFAKMGLDESEPAQQTLQKVETSIDSMDQLKKAMDPSALRNAIRTAVSQTETKLDAVQEASEALGGGMAPGTSPGGLCCTKDLRGRLKLARRLLSSEKLLRVLALAGRKIASALRKQAQKSQYARTEVSGVCLGADVGRLLPASLALLADPALEDLFYAQFAERKLLCYEIQGKERKAKGPIVIALDASGSMEGDKEEWSKAVALAMCRIAKLQKRTAAVLVFNTRVHKTWIWPKGNTRNTEVMDMISCFPGGGTSITAALNACLEVIKSEDLPEADVVLVSDGLSDAATVGHYRNEAKARGVTTYGIGVCASIALMNKFCDKVFSITDLTSVGQIEDVLFSI